MQNPKNIRLLAPQQAKTQLTRKPFPLSPAIVKDLFYFCMRQQSQNR